MSTIARKMGTVISNIFCFKDKGETAIAIDVAETKDDLVTSLMEQLEAETRRADEARAEVMKERQKGWEQKLKQDARYDKLFATVVSTLSDLGSMSLEELLQQDDVGYGYWVDSDTGEFCLTTAFCQRGGCDAEHLSFKNERGAYIMSKIMDKIEFTPANGGVCSECYAEYMDSII